MKSILRILVFLPLFFLFIGSTSAHRVNLFAWVEGDTVYVESKFSGGKKVKEGKIIVTDAHGVELLTGSTDEQGEFSFKIPKKTDLKIILLAGMGHKAEWTISVDEIELPITAEKSLQPKSVKKRSAHPADTMNEAPAAKEAAIASGSIEKQIQQAVETALDKKLKPVMKLLAESKEKSPSIRDIVGGIGYILGLVGIAAYIRSRREKK
jgi:nickel transport protein